MAIRRKIKTYYKGKQADKKIQGVSVQKSLTEFPETFIKFLLWLYISIHAKNSIPSWVHFFARVRAIFE